MKNYKRNKWVLKYNGQETSLPIVEWIDYLFGYNYIFRYEKNEGDYIRSILSVCGSDHIDEITRMLSRYGYQIIATHQENSPRVLLTVTKIFYESPVYVADHGNFNVGSYSVSGSMFPLDPPIYTPSNHTPLPSFATAMVSRPNMLNRIGRWIGQWMS